ncbi:MAG: hypothetical protein ACKO5P_04925 [Nodosilinea sp.]
MLPVFDIPSMPAIVVSAESSRDRYPRRLAPGMPPGPDGNGPTIPPARRGGVVAQASPRDQWPCCRRGTGGPVLPAPKLLEIQINRSGDWVVVGSITPDLVAV